MIQRHAKFWIFNTRRVNARAICLVIMGRLARDVVPMMCIGKAQGQSSMLLRKKYLLFLINC